jgi:hypothetical protein
MSVESTLLAKANDIFIARLRLTQTPKNTRCHASGEPLIQIITPAQPQELFLLGRCKVLQPSASSSQRSIQLETQDPDVGLSKGRSTRGGLVLCGCVRRINTCDDDPRSRYDLTRQVSAVVVGFQSDCPFQHNLKTCDLPLGVQDHVPRQFSDGYHVGSFLQLDRLGVYEPALVVYDHVRVERARVFSILVETIKPIAKWSSVSRIENDRYHESSDDVRITSSGQTTIRSNTTTWLVQHPRASTPFTLQEQGRRSGRELRGVDDDSGQSDELRQSVGLRRGTESRSETAAESSSL